MNPAQSSISAPFAPMPAPEADEASVEAQFYVYAFRCASDGIIAFDCDTGLILEANPAALEMYGYTVEEMYGLAVDEICAPPEITEDGVSGEVALLQRHQRKDGTIFPVDVSVGHFEAPRRTQGLLIVRDLTEALLAQRAEELKRRMVHEDRLTSIGRLAAGIGHEINNPAAYIYGNLQYILDELEVIGDSLPKTASDAQTALGDILAAVDESVGGVERIASITRELQAFARAEKDPIEMVDLQKVAEASCRIVRNVVRQRAQLVEELAPVQAFPGFRGRLSQVITNLMVNASQAIGEGLAHENSITVRCFGDDRHAIIQVIDTGKGMTAETAERIFEPFFTTKEVGEGTGLGLSLCREIVEEHGGRLSVESEIGEGSTFEVRIPFQNGLAVDSRPAAPKVEAPSRPARILVIDDEPLMCRVYRRVLSPPHELVTASGGREALGRLERDADFDVILCDIMMPDGDGLYFYTHLKESNPQLAERVIFCTGGAFTQALGEFLDNTDRPVLQKPVPARELRAVISRTLSDPRSRPQ